MSVEICRAREDHRKRHAAYPSRALVLSFCWMWLVSVLSVPARALDPNMNVSQFAHAAWLTQDGYFSGPPSVVAQTSDGYLWIGTGDPVLMLL